MFLLKVVQSSEKCLTGSGHTRREKTSLKKVSYSFTCGCVVKFKLCIYR